MGCISGRLAKSDVSSDNFVVEDLNLGSIVDATLNINIDELECTTHDDNGARVYIPNHHDATADYSLRWDEDDAGQSMILDAVFAKSVFNIRMRMQTGSGFLRFDAGAFATTFSPSGPLDDAAGLDLTLRLSNLVRTVQP